MRITKKKTAWPCCTCYCHTCNHISITQPISIKLDYAISYKHNLDKHNKLQTWSLIIHQSYTEVKYPFTKVRLTTCNIICTFLLLDFSLKVKVNFKKLTSKDELVPHKPCIHYKGNWSASSSTSSSSWFLEMSPFIGAFSILVPCNWNYIHKHREIAF